MTCKTSKDNKTSKDIKTTKDNKTTRRPVLLSPVFRVSLPQKLNYHKNQAVAIPKVANMSDPR
jgi:hypothetical protein